MSTKRAAPENPLQAVERRRQERKKQLLAEQMKLLKPKLGSKKWEEVKVKSGDRERVQTNLTEAGYCLYEFMDADGITVDVRFYPYNAINGRVIQKSLGKLEKADGTKGGQLLVEEAGKVSFLFSNIGGYFAFGKKAIKYRFVHSGDLGDDASKSSVEDTYAPQDVWWARRDPRSRKVYYINKHMKKTSWKLPPGAHLANAKYAKDVSKKSRRNDGVEGENAEKVHGNEYQQKMNSISKGATLADLPPPLFGWFLKANRKGKIQSRFFRLERQYLHYYSNETAYHNDEECKDPMDLYAIIGTKIPSENEGFEDHDFQDIHEVPFDLFTREKQLSIVPDTRWFKAKIVNVVSKNGAKFYDIHYDNGDNEEKVPSYRVRKPGDTERKEGTTFKKGDKIETQKDVAQARTLARVLKTWKPRIMSGWLMKVNKRGRQQKRWFQLLGSKMSYFESPHDLKQKKEPLNLEFLDSIKNPSPRVKNASKLGAFDLIFAGNKKIPQTMEEKRRAEEEDQKLEAKGAKEHALTFTTVTLYPAQNDPSTKNLVAILNDWQTHDELRYNKDKWHILKCRIRTHPATAFGVIVTDVEPYQVKTGYVGHTKPGVRITQLLSLPNGDLGPAEMAGVMLNDTLVEIDGRKIYRVQDAAKALKDKQVGTFTLCRLGDVTPESMMRMKRSMLTREQIEAEKTMKSKEEASERRKKAAQRQESARSRHGHRHHRGTKSAFGSLRARAGWRAGRAADGTIYWYHTNGMMTLTEPSSNEIVVDCGFCKVQTMAAASKVGGASKTARPRVSL